MAGFGTVPCDGFLVGSGGGACACVLCSVDVDLFSLKGQFVQ